MDSQPREATSQQVELLVVEYEQLREDERNLTTIQAGVLSVAVSILAAIPFALQQTCVFQGRPNELPPKDAVPCTVVQNLWLLAGVPIIPLAVIAFIMALGIVSIVRSFYIRLLEQELQRYALRSGIAVPGFRPMSYLGILNEVTSFTRGTFGFRAIVSMIVFSILIAFGGLTVYVAVNLPNPYKLAVITVIGTGALLLLIEQGRIVTSGRSFFWSACDRYVRGDKLTSLFEADTTTKGKAERSRASYLIFPRPDDTFKVAISFAVAAILLIFRPDTDFDWRRFIVVWLAFELLIYQARYQWNDIRGLSADLVHPERRRKIRLPSEESTAEALHTVTLSWWTILAKVVVFFIVGYLFSSLAVFSALFLIVLFNAVSYEYLRASTAREPLGRRPSVRTHLIWLLVCPGYTVRASIPLLAVREFNLDRVELLFVVAITMFGFMNVAMIWALEGSSYCTRNGRLLASVELTERPHMLRLLEYSEHRPTSVGVGPKSAGDQTVLAKKGRLVAPWNVAFGLAMTSGTLALCGMQRLSQTIIVLTLLGVVAYWLYLCEFERRSAQWLVVGPALLTSGAATIWALFTGDTLAYALAAMFLPAGMIGSTYVVLRHSSFQSFRDGFGEAIAKTVYVVLYVSRRALEVAEGKQTSRYRESLRNAPPTGGG